jgi:hypothetical protein
MYLNQGKNLTMRSTTKRPFYSFIALVAVSILVAACGKALAPVAAPAGSGMPLTPTSVTAAPPAGDTPTTPRSPLASPLQTPAPLNPTWQTFTHHNGISFQYPGDWQIVRDGTPEESIEFRLRVRPPGDVSFAEQIQVIASIIPREIISGLYYTYRGDVVSSRQFGDHKTVWDKQVSNSNHIDWHLTIRGYSSYAVNIDGVEYIGQEGGLTQGRLQAVHYDPTTQLAITLSKELDRDILIALHESGPDAVYPALAPVFEEILQSVAIAGSIQPGSTSTRPPSPLARPLQTPAPQNPDWQTFSHHNGVSLEYPTGWDVLRDGRPSAPKEFHLLIRPPSGNTSLSKQIGVFAIMIPREEASTLYSYAGDVVHDLIFGDYQTVWDTQILNANHIDWHLTIRGFSISPYGVERGLTLGAIAAVHYDATRELAIFVSQELDRDMLITLHESGPDAVYPAMVAVFEEILQSVSIQGK